MQIHKNTCPLLSGHLKDFIKISLFTLCFFTGLTLFGQEKKVTVVAENLPINKVFAQIEAQTEYSFAFINSNFDANRNVTISLQNTDLDIVLKQLLKGSGYSFTIRKNNIFLSQIKTDEKKHMPVIKKVSQEGVIIEKTESQPESKSYILDPASLYVKKYIKIKPQTSDKDSLDVDRTIDIINNLADKKLIYSTTPLWAVKSNLLLDLTGSISLGTEIKTGERYSFDLSFSYNPWEFNVNKNMKHILVQPEMRYWLCEPFNGHFFGLHGLYAHYNLTGLSFSDYMKNSRLQGDLYGVGLSYGYQWSLSKRWSLEGNFGVGYVHASYDRYACKTCREYIGSESKNYFAPTKASFSVIYFIK